jgi:2-polyprenyl-3-methyl-5-hydroxy-6-metoxy-1,4-benzoquinol methylase
MSPRAVAASLGSEALFAELRECVICTTSPSIVVHERLSDVHYGGPGRFSIRRCSTCGLAWLDPRPGRQAIAAYYGDSYCPHLARDNYAGRTRTLLRGALSLLYRARYGPVEQVSTPPHPGARMLDVGCGAGELIRAMRLRGWEVWGIEMDAAAAERALARAGGDAHVIACSVEEANCPAHSFDLITVSHVLEHLHDPLLALRRIHGWLRHGGQLRIWMPNIASLESRVFGRFWCGLDVPRHLFHFSPSSLTRLLDLAGFEVVGWRPQFQGSSLGDSVEQAVASATHRRHGACSARLAYNATVPLGWITCGLGNAAYVELHARAQGSHVVAAGM